MSQSDQFTAAQHVNALEGLSSDEHATLENLVRNAGQAARLALEHGTDALITSVRDLDARAAPMPVSGGREQNKDSLSRILDFPQPWPSPRPASTLHALQEWEGYVLEIGDTDFVARLVDLTAGSTHEHEEEEAVIPLAELSDEDSIKMRPGSIFRWVIGYERNAAGTKKRVSQIVFRDLPAITKIDLREGETWALETIRSLGL